MEDRILTDEKSKTA